MNYQNEMRRLVDDFVTQLADLWRQAAIDSMMGVGGGGGGGGASGSTGEVRRGPGRPPGSRNSNGASGSGESGGSGGGNSGGGNSGGGGRSRAASRGGKRTSDELEQLSTQFLDYVKKNPGLRIEQINKGLGTSTKDLALPIRKLVADGTVKVKGAKRATTYTMR